MTLSSTFTVHLIIHLVYLEVHFIHLIDNLVFLEVHLVHFTVFLSLYRSALDSSHSSSSSFSSSNSSSLRSLYFWVER